MLIIAFLFLMEKMTKFDPETSLWGLLARVQDNGSSDSPVMKTQLLLLHAWYNPEQNCMKGHGLPTTPGVICAMPKFLGSFRRPTVDARKSYFPPFFDKPSTERRLKGIKTDSLISSHIYHTTTSKTNSKTTTKYRKWRSLRTLAINQNRKEHEDNKNSGNGTCPSWITLMICR